MVEITLRVKDKKKVPFVKELIRSLKFVEVTKPKNRTEVEKKLLSDIDAAVDFIKKHEKKQVKARAISDLLDEL